MRNRGIEPALPELERKLITSAAAQMQGSRESLGRRIVGSRGPRLAAIGLACLAFGGTAMAATGIWDPGIGSRDPATAPSLSDTPVPPQETQALAVLRRAQTARDRGPQVRMTLHHISRYTALGIRPESIRYVGSTTGRLAAAPGAAAIVFSADFPDAKSSPPGETLHGNWVCVFRPLLPDLGAGGQHFCSDIAEILAGKAHASIEFVGKGRSRFSITVGLVPDGVKRVTALYVRRKPQQVAVTNNYYEIDSVPGSLGRPRRIVLDR